MRDLDLRDPLVRTGDLVVSASAGSGKTFTLTALVAAELGLESTRPHEILAATFGEAAASDLRERLLRPLDLLASLDERAWDALLEALAACDPGALKAALKALSLPERLAKSLDEVVQAAAWWDPLPPWASSPSAARAFWRRTRREAEGLRVSTIHALALSLLRQGEAPEEILDAVYPALLRLLREALRTVLDLPPGHPDHPPAQRLQRWAESSWEEISRAHDAHRDAFGILELPGAEAARAALEAALGVAIAAFAPFQEDFASACALKKDGSIPANAKRSKLLPLPREGADLSQRLAWAEAQSEALWKPEKYLEGPPAHWSLALHAAHATLQGVADALEARTRGLLLQGLSAFETAKAAAGIATFGDMVRRAVEGLQEGTLKPPAPRLLLVDEFQDTSRVQDAFLAELGARRTIRVGDLKQAIYSFRGGDPEILRERLETAGERAFRLPANHRSAAPIVELANIYVGQVWPRLDPEAKGLDAFQEARKPPVAPVGFLRTLAEGTGKDLPALSDWIAALSQEAGWGQALETPPRTGPRTRALLLRQRTGLPGLLLRLKARGIRPYVLASDGFWQSPGVRLLMAALEAVARPERPAPLVALLRWTAGMTDGELSVLAEDRLPGLGAFLSEGLPVTRQEKGRWIQGLLGVGTQEIAARCLAEGGLLALLASLEAHGPLEPLRARRNLAGFLSLLEELPADPAAAWADLQQLKEGPAKGDVPAEASGADLLIPTVHGSKGLEYDDVILPLLHGQEPHLRRGATRTDPGDLRLRLAWKLGQHPGRDYQTLKVAFAARNRRDGLNLLYVALTRARERMTLLLQGPEDLKEAPQCQSWAEWGLHLQAGHDAFKPLGTLPEVPPLQRPAAEVPALVSMRQPYLRSIPAAPDEAADIHGSLEARRQGEAMHAFVRDLLVRWEEPEAYRRCLECPPAVPRAAEMAQAFLARLEARGWRHSRRRTELPLEGAAASGAEGRADLVVWEASRIHLVDLKHSERFGEEELKRYGAQLGRYARVLAARHPGLPITAWLVALRSGEWIEVGLNSSGA